MPDLFQRVLGVLAALLLLVLGLLPGPGAFFVGSPLFFMGPLRFSFPVFSAGFLGAYGLGLLAGRVLFQHYLQSWVLPEIAALGALYWVPAVLLEDRKEARALFESRYGAQKKGFEEFRGGAEKLKRENNQFEKKLRQIEHLYDVIKEAGTTLNVQEMIELTKESTERMFNLEHFIIAVLTNDGKKYEVRIASGCDEAMFRYFEVDLESNGLAAVLGREKKPLWVPSVAKEPRFAGLGNLAIRSFVFLPFLVQDRVIGFMCSYSGREDMLDEEQFSNFLVFCNQISIGLQKSLLYEKVQKLSITDGLTKLYSHRHFKQRLEEELVLAGRYSSQLSLLILDIDHFKHYNDNYGHVAGDNVLMDVAKILKEQSDISHLVARYGGEEMVLIAPETTKEQAIELAEKIRKAVEAYTFNVGRETTKVTVSIGVATYPLDALTPLDLISRSDKALYEAKSRGRNRIVAYPIQEAGPNKG